MQFRSITLLIVITVIVAGAFVVSAQQEMQNMPGMNMSNKGTQKKRTTTRKKPGARKHKLDNMSGMNMPGMSMSGTHKHTRRKKQTARTEPSTTKHQMGNMPGMNMPGMKMGETKTTPTPTPSPQMNMPGMNMAQPSPSPSASPQKMEINMPGMQMPTASPNPQASPPQKMEMNMPMPSASPGASPQKMDMNMPMPGASPSPGAIENMKGMENMPGMGSMNMGPLVVMSGEEMSIRVGSSASNLMNVGQMGSGTSWQPATSPTNMMDKQAGKWLLMLHYNAVVGVNAQGGPRGVTNFESANWLMPMAFHKLGRGTLQLRGMFSFEPFTFARGGSPLLFQTGETFNGQPLVDRQHPHDLWMELSAQYTMALGERGTWFTYFGYPGEPALGPPAFMHRASASENPSATLSHHLQDSTHISFGVLTSGFTYRWFKLEGSIFNGREPDENRYNFEAHPWSSRSVRLSIAPNRNWSGQVSYGFLRHPEALEPGDVRRTTASISYNRPFNRGNWATSIIWGRNHLNSPDKVGNLNGYTAESSVNFLDKNYFYTRLELVDKDDLLRAAERARLGITQEHPSFRIGAYTFGGARDIWNTDKVSMAIGSNVTFYSKPSVLDQFYGNNPVSWRLFLRIRPAKMKMGQMHGIHGNMKSSEEGTSPKPYRVN
jgi:hypothetical protein